MKTSLAPELRHMVHDVVGIFGEVLRSKLGAKAFRNIETLREQMSTLRGKSTAVELKTLRTSYRQLEKLSPNEQFEYAQSFALMLELMNTCENAYRSERIRQRAIPISSTPESVVYVLTAHPTEARAPFNIFIFHQILKRLTEVFARPEPTLQTDDTEILRHLLEVAWNTSMVRTIKPQVRDEAEHIYSTLLREESLRPLLQARQKWAPIFVRTWVGGDKDGHPGVDEKAFLESLQISRKKILHFIEPTLKAVTEVARGVHQKTLLQESLQTHRLLRALHRVQTGDAKRVVHFQKSLQSLCRSYEKALGHLHPELKDLQQLLDLFPGLVVPLEFRESSDVMMAHPDGRGLAIDRMLKQLAKVSQGGDAKWYVRELIISMAESIEHIQVAAGLVKKNLGRVCIPIVPLFEQAHAQDISAKIIQQLLQDPSLHQALKKY